MPIEVVQLSSSEFEDHRPLFINPHWIKMFYQHESGVTHVLLGDGYPQEGFPVECIPVQESVGEVYKAVTGIQYYSSVEELEDLNRREK